MEYVSILRRFFAQDWPLLPIPLGGADQLPHEYIGEGTAPQASALNQYPALHLPIFQLFRWITRLKALIHPTHLFVAKRTLFPLPAPSVPNLYRPPYHQGGSPVVGHLLVG